VLDFRKNLKGQKPPSLREQSRWFWVLMMAAVGLILVVQVSKPQTWRFLGAWMAGATGLPGASDAPAGPPVDNRLDAIADQGAPSGGFVSPPPVAPEKVPSPPRPGGVRADLLASVEDDTPFTPFVSDDHEVWLYLFGTLQKSDDAALEEKTASRPTYAQLFKRPEAYRGQLVTVRGTVRRVHRLTAPPNPCGIEEYYETWLQPADNPSSPMIIYSLHLPERFPLGMDVAEVAEVTGLYFKRSAYQAADTVRTAPTLLARNLRWVPQSIEEGDEEQTAMVGVVAMLLILFGVMVLGALAGVWLVVRTQPPRGCEPPVPLDLDRLRQMEFAASEAASSATPGPPP
jgi:hypothetical protein